MLHGADRNGVVALGVGEHHRLLAQAADGQNRRLGLVEDGRAELAAEDAGVGQRKGAALDLFGQQLLGAGALGQVGDGAGQSREAQPLGRADDRHDQPPLQSHGNAQIDVGVIVDEAVERARR